MDDEKILWIADFPLTQNKYLALFNPGEEATIIEVKLKDIGFSNECQVCDLLNQKDLGLSDEDFSFSVPAHGSGIFKAI